MTKEYRSIGSVNGVLMVVGAQRYVVEAVNNMRVFVGNTYQGKRLTWPPEGSRVAVHGLLTRNDKGHPIHIRPEEIAVLPGHGEWSRAAAQLGQWAAGLGKNEGGEQR